MFFTTLDILKEDGHMHMYTPIRTNLLFFLFTMFYFIVSRKQCNRVITVRLDKYRNKPFNNFAL